jgi:beta-mannanase
VEPWFDELYPGDDVVDWVAYDPYATAYPGFHAGDFSDLVNRAPSSKWPGMYDYLTENHPGKPIMLAEWGVAEDTSSPGVKPDFFRKVPDGLKKYPAIKAMVYFDSPNATFGDTRTNSTSRSQAAFNEMVSDRVFGRVSVP